MTDTHPPEGPRQAGWTGRYFEDFVVGDVYRHRLGRTVTETDNIWMTLLSQNTAPVHFDRHYAAQTEFGRPLVDSTITLALVTGQSVTDVSQNVMANLGWDRVRMPNPLFEGETVYSESEVLTARPSGSRPDVGVVTVRTVGFTAEGKIVITFERTLLVYRRGHGPNIAQVRPNWDPRSLRAAGLEEPVTLADARADAFSARPPIPPSQPDPLGGRPVTMSHTPHSAESASKPTAPTGDMKFEVTVIPVSDVDRSKAFYQGLGWRLDADFAFDNGFRVVQFTPPGSGASVQFGSKITSAAPGSARGLYLIVSDIQTTHAALAGLGIGISEVFHPAAPGAQFAPDGPDRVSGRDPDGTTYGSFTTFSDPDGNQWLVQEVTERLPGRTDPAETTFASINDLANAMRRASVAHGEHERRSGGEYDVNWPDWYAAYIVAEQAGTELPM